MATWSTPHTFTEDETVSAETMNTYISDNLTALKEPPTADYQVDESSNYTTTSTTWEDVDDTNLALTIITTGGDVLVGFFGNVTNSTTHWVKFNIDVDGTPVAGDDGLMSCYSTSKNLPSFVYLVTDLEAGSHTFKLQWKVSGGTGYLYAGAGTLNVDVHPQFWVKEL